MQKIQIKLFQQLQMFQTLKKKHTHKVSYFKTGHSNQKKQTNIKGVILNGKGNFIK